MKKWRALSSDRKQPYLQRARDNRSAQQAQLRTKKAQQVRAIICQRVNGSGHEKSQLPNMFSRDIFKVFLFGGDSFSSHAIAVYFPLISFL